MTELKYSKQGRFDVAHKGSPLRRNGACSIESIKGTVSAGGTVRLPLDGSPDRDATYTIEFEENGRLFRWVGQRPHTYENSEEGSFAVFDLPQTHPCEQPQ